MFFARGIGWGQKWWQTLLEIFFACSQWEGPSMHSWCLGSFPFNFWVVIGGGVGRGIFFIFPWFPMCSHYVPFKFSMGSHMFSICSPNSQCVLEKFSIAPHFYPICFGTCSPPFTYIGGPKGLNRILQNRAFCFGESPWFHFFFEWWTNQVGMLSKKKKLERHLI